MRDNTQRKSDKYLVKLRKLDKQQVKALELLKRTNSLCAAIKRSRSNASKLPLNDSCSQSIFGKSNMLERQ